MRCIKINDDCMIIEEYKEIIIGKSIKNNCEYVITNYIDRDENEWADEVVEILTNLSDSDLNILSSSL